MCLLLSYMIATITTRRVYFFISFIVFPFWLLVYVSRVARKFSSLLLSSVIDLVIRIPEKIFELHCLRSMTYLGEKIKILDVDYKY